MDKQNKPKPAPQIEELSRIKATEPKNVKGVQPDSPGKPKLGEPFSPEGAKQPELDRELWEKNQQKREDSIQKRVNVQQAQAPNKTAKGGSKIGDFVKGAIKGTGKLVGTMLKGAGLIGTTIAILEPEPTVDEATEQAALQAFSEQKGNQFAQSQEKATSVAVEKDDEPTPDNSGVVTTPEQGTKNVNAPSSYNQLDKDAVISSMQEDYDINSTTLDTSPTIDDAERDGVLMAMSSDYTDNEDIGSFYSEAPDVDMDMDGTDATDSGGDGGDD